MRHLRNPLLTAAAVFSVCARATAAGSVTEPPTPPGLPLAQAQAARQAVAQGEGRWVVGWQAHDAALIAALFAADGIEMGRGGSVTRGRRAIAARFARLFGAIGPVQANRQTVDLWLMGGTAYEAGRYTYTFPPLRPGFKPGESAGNYVTVWQKQKNGQWLIHSDVAVAAR